jgi:enoyl-CoA hydratase/carnithine racemase
LARAKQIVFDGDQYSAQQFAQWNVINHVVPDAELRERAETLARSYAAGPTLALAADKALIRAYLEGGIRDADRAILESGPPLFESDDMRSAVDTVVKLGARKLIGNVDFRGR